MPNTAMNVYLISWADGNNYDCFDSAVVIAPTAEVARNIKPQHNASLRERARRGLDGDADKCELVNWKAPGEDGEWATQREDVEVTFLGYAPYGSTRLAVVCASFNAG